MAGKVLSVIPTFNSSFFFLLIVDSLIDHFPRITKQLFLLCKNDNIVNNVKKNTDSPTQTSASNVLHFPKKNTKTKHDYSKHTLNNNKH